MTQTITELNSETLATVRARISELLDAVSDELGISVELGSCRYSPRKATLKVEIATMNEDGEVESPIEIDFKAHCHRYGLHPDDLGRAFRSNGSTHRIVGLKPRNHKYPIITESGGRTYKMPANYVKGLLP